jgi:uncharacterized membrane protein YgcG
LDSFVRLLLALVAALNSAVAAPLDAGEMPDRPPIVAPTAQSFPAAAVTATLPLRQSITVVVGGTVTEMQAGMIVVSGEPIQLSPSTTVNGNLKVGAEVNVEANRSGESLQATQVEVNDDAQPTKVGKTTATSSSDSYGPTEAAHGGPTEDTAAAASKVGGATPTESPLSEHQTSDQQGNKPDAGDQSTSSPLQNQGGTPSKDSGSDSGKSSGAGTGSGSSDYKESGSHIQTGSGSGSNKSDKSGSSGPTKGGGSSGGTTKGGDSGD